MPSIITHYLCGARTIDLLENTTLSKIISQYRQPFNVGTQGPDILFYYRVWPWTKSHGVEKIGTALHEQNINAFFSHAIKYIINQDCDERNMLTAYLCGFICHYALDLHTHPYIFYKTGFVRPGEPFTSKFTCYHRMFETNLDVLMLHRVLNKRPIDLKAHQLISLHKSEARKIGRMYQSALDTCGLSLSAEQIAQAIKDMVTVQAVLRDKLGIKKALLSWIEKSLGKYPLVSSMIYPSAVVDGRDYLNLQGAAWSLPWDPLKKNNSSFVELFDLAVWEAKKMCETLFSYLYGDLSLQETLEYLGNRSFSTGVDCTCPVDFINYDCIFEPLTGNKKSENTQKNT